MLHRCCLASLIVMLVAVSAPAGEKAAREYLESRKLVGGQLRPLTDEALSKALPGRSFVALLFPQYPVGGSPPDGFAATNLLLVEGANKVTVISTRRALEALARSRFHARDDAQSRLAVRAWLLLSAELAQDGYYKFQVIDESLRSVPMGDRIQASGRLVVVGGGNGEISVQMTFDATGALTDLKENVKLLPGPRPICQAGKLLDPDPLVRRICEADLLIMGEAAHDYLMTQRARSSPELQREIDRVWQRILRGER